MLDVAPGRGYLVAHLPSHQVPALSQQLPDLTGGEGVLVTELAHHAPVPADGPTPSHPRPRPDPLDRVEWFRDMPR